MFHPALHRFAFVFCFFLIVAVIRLGHSPSPYANSGPSGFTRIARDLDRKQCKGALLRDCLPSEEEVARDAP